jgi:ABC-type antimicrobial peptide transport system permease subunit
MSFYGITTVVRGTMPPGALATAVREQIHALDANLPVFNVETMNEHVNKSMLLPRLCATLLGIFGAGGAILAMVGLYGVISFAARARTREIGIRMALGAQPATVLQMILREGMLLVGAGLAIGMGLSFAATRFTRSLLYGISTTDPVTFTIVPVAMLLVAAVAVWVPARRAARIAPREALHHD